MARPKGRGAKNHLKNLREECAMLIKDDDYTWNSEEYFRKVICPYRLKGGTKRGWDYGQDGTTPVRWSSVANVMAFSSEIQIDKKEAKRGTVLDLSSGLPLDFSGEPSDVTFFAHPSYVNTYERLVHSAQKPVLFLSMLILMTSNEGETVIDPFMGSGSTGVASLICERNFIGIENATDTFQNAVNWISNCDCDKWNTYIKNHVSVKSGTKKFSFGSRFLPK